MKSRLFSASLLLLSACGPVELPVQLSEPQPQATSAQAFDAQAAWDEFEDLFRLFYAYIERDDFDVEELLRRVEARATATTSAADFRHVLQSASYLFADPHLIVGPLRADDYNVIYTAADLKIILQRGKFVVADVRADSAADEAQLRPGWELTHVEGVPVREAVNALFDGLIDEPTDKQLAYAATVIANGKREGDRKLDFVSGGKTLSVELVSPRRFAGTVTDGDLLEVRVVNGIGIIRLNNSLGNNELIHVFDDAMRRVVGTEGLILDLRNTPSGGNTEVGRSIIGHFVNDTQPYQVHEIPSLEREFTVPRRFIELVKPREPHYDPARVVVLGGYWTGSMGEGVLIGLDGAAGVHTIASDMGDLLGGITNYRLELSGAKLDLANEALFHVNGEAREDYVADTPLASADRDANGGDPAMRAAMKRLRR